MHIKAWFLRTKSGSNPSPSGKSVGNTSNLMLVKINLVDKYFSEKKTGFISLQKNSFNFIGPDQQEFCFDSIDKCLHISQIIRRTNEPNYKCARFPLKFSLYIGAWESRLADYPDKRVINYLKFGLSLVAHKPLNNKQVTNRYSALAHPQAV